MKTLLENIKENKNIADISGVVETSIHTHEDKTYFIRKEGLKKFLYIVSDEELNDEFDVIEKVDGLYKLSFNNKNSHALRSIFDWMNPIKRTGHAYSFGLGDRLGIASNAHLQLFKGKGVLPVLAQQSIRELNLTGRTYDDVLSSAAWAVFEEGYHDGYSADGDHLKNPFEIDYAIKCGFKMITLDCSDHINNDVANYSVEKLNEEYNALSENSREYFENVYLDETFDLEEGISVTFTKENLMETVLIFNQAVIYATEIYEDFIEPNDLDFEISIDETIVPTTPENHFFIANELNKADVILETMAPKFHGEFQKAIDYRGNLEQFEKEYRIHEAIAKFFGYRLSIHSGSDKFAVYPTIADISKEGWHVKTAGTNWLEALRVIARNDAVFMKELYAFALDNLHIAKQYYEIDATVENSTDLASVTSETIHQLLEDEMPRQVLHVTFGLILQEKIDDEHKFKDRIYEVLTEHADDYTYVLNKHIGKHLSLLNK